MLTTPGKIRALGFDWPHSAEIEKHAVTRLCVVDLGATLARLESGLAFYEKEIGEMHAFARQWGAEVDDITNQRDAHGEARIAYRDAIRHVQAVIAAHEK